MLNDISIIGNIGRKESKLINGKQLAKISVAVSEGKDEPATWFDCIFWGKPAEFIDKYLDKGAKVFVNGKLVIREYEKKDGSKGKAVEISGYKVISLTNPKSALTTSGDATLINDADQAFF